MMSKLILLNWLSLGLVSLRLMMEGPLCGVGFNVRCIVSLGLTLSEMEMLKITGMIRRSFE